MNANAWFKEALEARFAAQDAKSATERQRHGRNAIDALFAAASLGHAEALYTLGIDYQHGAFGIIPKRLDLAEHWFRLAVSAGDGHARLALGTLLMEANRKEEGRKWLRAALAHGDGGAACHLGRDIEAKSPSRALRLYLRGVELGEPFAAYCAAEVLEARKTRKALLQAEALYKKAVRKLPFGEKELERVRQKLSLVAPRGSRSTRRHG